MAYFFENSIRKAVLAVGLILLAVMVVWGIENLRVAEPASPTGLRPVWDDDVVILTFAAYEHERTLYQPLMDAFHMEHPDIGIQFVPLDFPQVSRADLRAWMSAADTILLNNRSLALTSPDYFLDLTPLIQADPAFSPEDFYPGYLAYCSSKEGQILGIPLTFRFSGVFFDPAALSSAGLPLPEAEWTLGELEIAARQLSEARGDHTRYGFADGGSLLSILIDLQLEKSGGELSPSYLEDLLLWYQDLVHSGALQHVSSSSQYSDYVALLRGPDRPALWAASPGDPLGTVLRTSEDPFSEHPVIEMGYVPFPIIDGERNTTPVWGQCAAASVGTAYPRQVYTWINYLSHHWLTRSRSTPEELAQFPARKSAAEKEGFWNYLPEHIRDTVSYIIHHPYIGSRYPKEQQAVMRAAESVLSGEEEPLSALAAAESEIAAGSVPLPPEQPLVVASPGSSADSRIVDYYYQGGDPEQLRILASLAEQFNRTQTDYKVAVSERLLLTGDYGSVADNIFSHADCATLSWMDTSGMNLVLDLSPFFAAQPDLLQDYDSGDAARYTIDGKMFGLPAYKQPILINYNPALLDKAGISHPSWEWSYGDFLDAITRTADPDAGIYGYLYSGWDNLLSQAAGVNMILPGEEPTRPDLDTAALQIYLAFLEDLNKSGVLLAQNPGEPDAISQALVSGKVAFWIGAAGEAGEWFLFPDQHIDYPYGQVVFPEGGQGIDILLDVISSAHYISAASQSPETCWGWFDFLSRQVSAFPGLPARRSLAASPEWEALVGTDMAQNLRRAVENSREQTSLDVEIIKPMKGWIIEAEQQVLNGDSPTAVAQFVGLRTDAYLACIQDQDLSALERQTLLKSIWNCAAQAVD